MFRLGIEVLRYLSIFSAVLRYLPNFFAVLRCSELPNVPLLTASDVSLQARAQVKTLLLRRTMQCLYLNGVSDIMTPDRLLNLYC